MGIERARAVTTSVGTLSLSPGFDPPEGDLRWQHWVARYDRMQARYLVKREERFALLARLVREVAGLPAQVVELGCGPGRLMEVMLGALPGVEVWGIDFDPAAFLLAQARLAHYGQRAHLALVDLRSPTWADGLPGGVDAVISATALHWLKPGPLATLYGQIAALLRPGGLFLNADHVGSDHPPLQAAWERHRAEMRAAQGDGGTDEADGNPLADRNPLADGNPLGASLGPADPADVDSSSPEPWDEFWTAYTAALGLDTAEEGARVLGGWDGGVEQGLPLAWHLDALREAGFGAVDCFWRCDCDAIYGGFKLF